MDFSQRAGQYNRYRKADPTLVRHICRLMDLPKGSTIADIGAGTGNYSGAFSQCGYRVLSVEPEETMRSNTKQTGIRWIDSFAEDIHLPDGSVDAAVAINSVHHFSDFEKAQREIYRVLNKGPSITFTFDPEVATKMWIFDYWPSLETVERSNYPPLGQVKDKIAQVFGNTPEEIPFLLPRDFEDVFSAALWDRPQVLFEKDAISAMSLFSSLDTKTFQDGLERLAQDLEDGAFKKKYADLESCPFYDAGCRILLVRKG